jgi:hypothetical protein
MGPETAGLPQIQSMRATNSPRIVAGTTDLSSTVWLGPCAPRPKPARSEQLDETWQRRRVANEFYGGRLVRHLHNQIDPGQVKA